MKHLLSIALAATALVATPAMAQTAPSTFTGPRIGATVGFSNDKFFGTQAFTYGAEAGYDIDAGGAVLGVTAEIQDNKYITRELALTARAGARVGSKGLLYVAGGYSNIRAYGVTFDGVRFGAGGELALGKNAYVKLEQRYGRYQYGTHLWQSVIGAGVRF